MCSGNCNPSCSTCAGIATTRGDRGLPGPPGITPTIGATVTGLAPGTNPTVVTNGTVLFPIFDFGIPAGATGTQGIQGIAGTNGIDGKDSYSYTTATFVQPAVSSTVIVNVFYGLWAQQGQVVYIPTGGYYLVSGVSLTQLLLTNLGYPGNAAPAASISSGAGVGPAGLIGPVGPTGTGTPGVNGTTPVLRSGSGVPSNGLGVNGDWYIQQVNPGKLIVYGKASGVYTTQGSLIANRLFVFTADPNTLSLTPNDGDQGTWVDGNTVNQYYYNAGTSTWVLFNTFTNGGALGPPWAFYATKTVIQPVGTGLSDFTKINFEDSSTNPPNFNNSGAWSLNTYTFTTGLTKAFYATNIVASRTGTSGVVSLDIAICLNGNTGAPLATAVLTINNASATGTLGIVFTTPAAFSTSDEVSVYANPNTSIPGLSITGGEFYIQ